jgi:hypothetical protein
MSVLIHIAETVIILCVSNSSLVGQPCFYPTTRRGTKPISDRVAPPVNNAQGCGDHNRSSIDCNNGNLSRYVPISELSSTSVIFIPCNDLLWRIFGLKRLRTYDIRNAEASRHDPSTRDLEV